MLVDTESELIEKSNAAAEQRTSALQEWSLMSRIFQPPTRPHPDKLNLSRTLKLATAAAYWRLVTSILEH